MMPLSDLFRPDTNFVSARSVYPTMNGGSVASAAGAMSMQSNSIVPDPVTGGSAATTTAGPAVRMSGNSVYWWLGLVALLVVMVMVARKAGGEEDFRNIRPTLYNALTITLTSIVGIVGMKVLAAKYRIPGASDIILAA